MLVVGITNNVSRIHNRVLKHFQNRKIKVLYVLFVFDTSPEYVAYFILVFVSF